MLKNGIGVKYSIDIEFWKDIDSTAILEPNNSKTIKVKAIKLKDKPKKVHRKKNKQVDFVDKAKFLVD